MLLSNRNLLFLCFTMLKDWSENRCGGGRLEIDGVEGKGDEGSYIRRRKIVFCRWVS